ncbi:MAG: radical SAM protein, partial [Mariprofundaceae bacterium]|nr:radical SAM protein [Mariprofundaceae bacterium]
ESLKQVNGVELHKDYLKRQIQFSSQHAKTWVQSCFFALDDQAPSQHEVDAYLSFLQEILDAKINISGVLLYGLARPSMQPQANRLSQLPESWMQALAQRIEKLGIEVKLSV